MVKKPINPDDKFWLKLDAPIKGKRRAFGQKNAEAIALPHLSAWGFDSQNPTNYWVWVSAFSLHFLFLLLLISIPPVKINPQDVMRVRIIPEELKKEPPPIIKPPEPIKEIIKPKPKEIVEKTETLPTVPEPTTTPVTPPEPPKARVEIKPPEIIPEPLKIQKQDLINSPRPKILKQSAPQSVELEPEEEPAQVNMPNIPSVNSQVQPKLQNRSIQLQQPIIERQIIGRKLDAKQSPRINNNPIPQIDVNELERQAAAQRQAEAQRQAAENAARQAAANNNSAPIAKGGELAPAGGSPPSGAPASSPASSGVTAIAGGPPASAAPPSGGPSIAGTLPRQPRNYGTGGRNVFEQEEDGSFLAKMRRAGDCSEVTRERSERCPDWNPLEPGRQTRVNVPPPILPKAPGPAREPMPHCPPGTPHSNFGITCLPTKNGN